ncbi:hypothetical protein KIMH_03850 [Bombiscardovia apis]|uniref:Secreted protein n=1 Tax=Bombiscardovia apis TaxID=2932182 RepID=A0ABM8BBK8_9BIFI|nr:hypothetical protein KIMH_03850 [Bombiscardovia apis]
MVSFLAQLVAEFSECLVLALLLPPELPPELLSVSLSNGLCLLTARAQCSMVVLTSHPSKVGPASLNPCSWVT